MDALRRYNSRRYAAAALAAHIGRNTNGCPEFKQALFYEFERQLCDALPSEEERNAFRTAFKDTFNFGTDVET